LDAWSPPIHRDNDGLSATLLHALPVPGYLVVVPDTLVLITASHDHDNNNQRMPELLFFIFLHSCHHTSDPSYS